MNSIINVFKKHNNDMEKVGKTFRFWLIKNYKTTLKKMVTLLKKITM